MFLRSCKVLVKKIISFVKIPNLLQLVDFAFFLIHKITRSCSGRSGCGHLELCVIVYCTFLLHSLNSLIQPQHSLAMASHIGNFLPSIGALALVSTIILISSSQSARKFGQKLHFILLIAASAIAVAYLQRNAHELRDVFQAYKNMTEESRFALTVIIVVISYFGGALYLGNGGNSTIDVSTPASCDSNTEFDVPLSLPKDDKVLFDELFHRYCPLYE